MQRYVFFLKYTRYADKICVKSQVLASTGFRKTFFGGIWGYLSCLFTFHSSFFTLYSWLSPSS